METSAVLEQIGNHDRRYWRRHIIIGMVFAVARGVVGGVYAVQTWSEPHRPAVLVLAAGIAIGSALLGRWAVANVDSESARMRFLLWWAVVNLVSTLGVALLDSGLQSPVMLSLFPILTYVAMASSPRFVATVGGGAVLCQVLLAVLVDEQASASAGYIGVSLVLVTGLLLAFARNTAHVRIARDAATANLTELATRDPLTGVLNRRAWLGYLRDEIERSRRSGRSMAVVMFDLDHFKAVNDTAGHAAGDAVLCTVSRVVEASLRPHERLGRLGGEEFCVLLADADLEGAFAVAERLRSEVELSAETSMPVTISAGVAVLDGDFSGDAEHLLELADAAMYTAKSHGRNRVEYRLRVPAC